MWTVADAPEQELVQILSSAGGAVPAAAAAAAAAEPEVRSPPVRCVLVLCGSVRMGLVQAPALCQR